MEKQDSETTLSKESKAKELSSEGKRNVSFKWLMVTIILGLIIVIGFFFIGDFKENIAVFKSIDLWWFALSGGCLLIFWLSESLTMMDLT